MSVGKDVMRQPLRTQAWWREWYPLGVDTRMHGWPSLSGWPV